MTASPFWSFGPASDPDYQHKFIDTCRILSEWFEPFGGIERRDVLEFGCGEGTMALGMALQYPPRRIVGVEVLDIVNRCRELAEINIGLSELPANLELRQIAPGDDLLGYGQFDAIFTWSVFEHVEPSLLGRAFQTLAAVLRPGGAIFLQISPLFYSAPGSHLLPWIGVPWGHLLLPLNEFERRLLEAPDTPSTLRNSWSVYIPTNAPKSEERRLLWEAFTTLNKASAPQLERHAKAAGLKIVRDYRTLSEQPIPTELLRYL